MKTKNINRGEWYFHVYASKDSPMNQRMWSENAPDDEYNRGYSVPGAYTTMEDAVFALKYYKSGYVFKTRYCNMNNTRFWREEKYVCEMNYKSKVYSFCGKPVRTKEIKHDNG